MPNDGWFGNYYTLTFLGSDAVIGADLRRRRGAGRVQAIFDFSFIATSFLDAKYTMTGDGNMADKHSKGTHNPSQSSTQRWDNEGGAIKGVHAKRSRVPSQQSRKKKPQRRGKR